MNTFLHLNGKTYQGALIEVPDRKYTKSAIRSRAIDEVLKILDEEPTHGESGIRMVELASIGSKIQAMKESKF